MLEPANMALWQGRIDPLEAIPGLRWHQVIKPWLGKDDLKHAPTLLGFACDEGVRRNQGRPGAKFGPNALRQALANLSYQQELTPWDAGNIVCNDQNLEQAQTQLANRITAILAKSGQAIVIGGGHEMAWGSYQGLANYLTQENKQRRIGIINFDAHFDLRKPSPQANSGTPFHQIALWCEENKQPFHYLALGINPSANTNTLYDFAKKHKVTWLEDVDCTFDAMQQVENTLQVFLDKIDELYVTVCLDVFPAHTCPGVSAPAALGVEARVIIKLIQSLKTRCRLQNIHWRLSDIAELNPQYDQNEQTAKLAARLVYELAK